MIYWVIVQNNPLKYTDPSGHGWFKRIRKAVSRAFRSVRKTVQSVLSKPEVKFAIGVVAAVQGYGEGGDFINGLIGLTQAAQAGLELADTPNRLLDKYIGGTVETRMMDAYQSRGGHLLFYADDVIFGSLFLTRLETKYGKKLLDRLVKLVTPASKYTIKNFSEVASRVSQKQMRHILGRKEYRGGGYLDSLEDAQTVLDAYRSGSTKILGKSSQGFPIVRYNLVTGTNVNIGAGVSKQLTNVFMIKWTKSPSILPMNPKWVP